MQSQERQGNILIMLQALLWGVFPIVTIVSYQSLSPLVSLAGSTAFSAVLFAGILTMKRKWRELADTSALGDILLTAFFIGIVYYALFFYGLRETSAGNASIIALSEIFFSYLFFSVWKKEHFPRAHVIGSLLIVVGAAIVLFPNMREIHRGDLFVLLAACIAPVGNFFQQRARQKVSSETVMFMRSIITAPCVFGIAYVLGEQVAPGSLRTQWVALAVNGLLLLGASKLLWIEGIHRISVTKANALSNLSPLITLIAAMVVIHQMPTIWQLLSLIPLGVGTVLLNRAQPSLLT